MLTTIFRTSVKHYKENLFYYAILTALFLAGGIVALVTGLSMTDLTGKELSLYLNDFFVTINKTGSDGFAIFQMAVWKNLKEFCLLFLCAVMVVGSPLIGAYCGVKGFISFFTLSLFFRTYGIRAVLFYLVGMLPHILILLPCYAYLAVYCMKFSLSLTRTREMGDFKARFLRFCVLISVLYLVSVMSALLQAYIEPLFVKMISVYFITG